MYTTSNNEARSPTLYCIRVEGCLDRDWCDWFEGLHIAVQDGETILTGPIPDQPALHGVLKKMRDLGLTLVALERMAPATDSR